MLMSEDATEMMEWVAQTLRNARERRLAARISNSIKAAEIRSACKRLGLSQGQFADVFGVSASTLRKWEQGQYAPERSGQGAFETDRAGAGCSVAGTGDVAQPLKRFEYRWITLLPITLHYRIRSERSIMFSKKDVDKKALRGGRIAVVLGYGSQGRAHALNLSKSGYDVVVGVRKGNSWTRAKKDWLQVAEPAAAVKGAQLVAMLVPDLTQNPLCAELR